MLLFDYLEELVYSKDSGSRILRVSRVRKKEGKPHHPEATAQGERIDAERHHSRGDVKAVTSHNFRLEKTNRRWRVSVIPDIQKETFDVPCRGSRESYRFGGGH